MNKNARDSITAEQFYLSKTESLIFKVTWQGEGKRFFGEVTAGVFVDYWMQFLVGSLMGAF